MYSFGILLLEIVSAKKPIEKLPGGVKRDIVQWVTPYVQKGLYNHIGDPKLKGKLDLEQLRSVVMIAMRCTDSSPEKRPSMMEVVEWLKGGIARRRTKDISVYENEEEEEGRESKNKEKNGIKLMGCDDVAVGMGMKKQPKLRVPSDRYKL